MLEKFNVQRSSLLCNKVMHEYRFVPASVPDHSVITWIINVDFEKQDQAIGQTTTYDKFDVQSIPENFLLGNDTLTEINAVVGEFEGSYRVQNDIDFAYGKLCNIIKGELFEKLNHMKIKISNGSSNKR